MSKWLFLSLVGVLALALMAAPAGATVLAPGATNQPVSTGTVSGTVLADFIQNFSFGAGDTGHVEAAAVASTVNPFGSGDISFVFQFTVTGGLVEHLTDGSLIQAGVDVEQTASLTLAGTTFGTGTVSSSGSNRTIDGSVVSFDFSGAGAVMPGETSFVLIINTNQTTFTPGTLGLIDGGGQTLNGFSATPVPEPASATLLLAGLPFLALRRWRRRS